MKLLPEGGEVISGKITFKGRDILQSSEEEIRTIRGSKISFIFQNPATFLNPVLKIGDQIIENIILHQKIKKKDANESAIRLLTDVGLRNVDKIIDCYPHQLSGGMQQRAMIAMAISCNPDLIIADECTTALDVTTQLQILNLLKDISKKINISIIIITHNLAVVAYLCTRTYVMHEGKTIEEAKTNDLFFDPKHDYTKKLLKIFENYYEEKFYSTEGESEILKVERIKKIFRF